MTLEISLFEQITQTRGIRQRFDSFKDFAKEFVEQSKERVAKKELNALWSPAAFREETRSLVNAELVYFLVLDLDHLSDADINDAINALRDGNLAFVAHASFSDAPHDRCWRIVIPLSEPVLAKDWPSFRSAALEYLSIQNVDGATKDASRVFFLPVNNCEIIEHTDGEPLNIDAIPYSKNPFKQPQQPITQATSFDLTEGSYDTSKLAKKVSAAAKTRPVFKLIEDCVTNKKPLSAPGERHSTLARVCGALSYIDLEAPVEYVVEYLRPALNQWENNDPKPWDEQALKMLTTFRRRDLSAVILQNKARVTIQDANVPGWDALRTLDSSALRGGELPVYSKDEIEAWAGRRGITGEQLSRQVVLQRGDEYFYFFGGEWQPRPIPSSELQTFLWKYLAPWHGHYGCKVFSERTLTEPDTGEVLTIRSPLKKEALLDRFASRLVDITTRYDTRVTQYNDRDMTLVIGRAQPQPEPEYSPEIDRWLETLFDQADKRKFSEWLKLAPNYNKPLSMLVIQGKQGVGKGILVEGIGAYLGFKASNGNEMWRTQYTQQLEESPLVFFDEHLPPVPDFSKILRALITDNKHVVRQKYRRDTYVHGHLRLVHARNQLDSQLFAKEQNTLYDVEAVGRRILVLECRSEASDYLIANGNYAMTDAWIKNGTLAKHLAWVVANTEVDQGQRFGVDGNYGTKYALSQAVENTSTGPMLEIAAKAFLDMPISDVVELFAVKYGRLYCSSRLFSDVDNWQRFAPGQRQLTAVQAGKALTNLAADKRRFFIKDQRVNMRGIDLHLIYEWCRQTNYATVDDFKDRCTEVNIEYNKRFKNVESEDAPVNEDTELGVDQ